MKEGRGLLQKRITKSSGKESKRNGSSVVVCAIDRAEGDIVADEYNADTDPCSCGRLLKDFEVAWGMCAKCHREYERIGRDD